MSNKPGLSANLFGYPVSLLPPSKILFLVQAALEEGRSFHVITLNPEMVMQGNQNAELDTTLKQAELILPDGAGVVWALKLRGEVLNRLPGIEFAETLLEYAEKEGHSVAIIGATQATLALAVDNISSKFPNLIIAYQHHGFFTDRAERDAIAAACAKTRPKMVFLALGVPKQEIWIHEYRNCFEGAVFMGVGGSLDVWSGKTQRAPLAFRKMNIEWVYRITKEPWRLKRIYRTLPLFALKVILNLFSESK